MVDLETETLTQIFDLGTINSYNFTLFGMCGYKDYLIGCGGTFSERGGQNVKMKYGNLRLLKLQKDNSLKTISAHFCSIGNTYPKNIF